MKLIAMDCDGTVEISAGPVPLSLLRQLQERGCVLYAIGNQTIRNFLTMPSPYDNTGIGLGDKSKALRWMKEKHPGAERYIIVDDNPAQYHEGWEGWEFFTPQDFLKAFGGGV